MAINIAEYYPHLEDQTRVQVALQQSGLFSRLAGFRFMPKQHGVESWWLTPLTDDLIAHLETYSVFTYGRDSDNHAVLVWRGEK